MNAKKLKRFLSVVLSLSMVLSVNTVNFASEVTEIANSDAHVHEDAAEEHVHEWVLQETVTPATCLEDGVGVYACEGCEGTEEDVIPATKHSYEAEDFDKDLPENYEIVKEASCTEAGVKAYTCANEGCTEETEGHVKEEEIPAAGHTWENGECTVCHESQNVRELGDASNEELKSSGHQQADAPYEAPVVDFTDKEPAEQAEEPVKAPAMSNEVKQPEMFAAEGGDTTPPAEPSEPAEPTECKDGEHVFVSAPSIIKPATCTVNGIGRKTCQCGETAEFVTLQPRHAYQEVGTDGQPEYEGEGDTKKPVLKADYSHKIVWVEADCITDGRTVYTCTACPSSTAGHTYDVITKAAGHAFGEPTREPATCVSPFISKKTCTECGFEDVERGEKPDPNNHEYNADGTTIPATCTEPAKTGKLCELCGKTDGELTPVEGSKPLGHSFEAKDGEAVKPGLPEGAPKIGKDVEPDADTYVKGTCIKAGHEEYSCDRCDEIYKWDIPARPEGHEAGEPEIVPADCVNNAKFSSKCKICGESMGADIDVVDYYLLMNADTEGYTEEDAIADAKGRGQYKLGHDLTETPHKPATCTQDGISEFTCKRTDCKFYESRVVKAHHSFEDEDHNLLVLEDYENNDKGIDVVTDPTCTQAGVAVGTCTVCGEKKTGLVVPAIGHKYDEGTVEGTNACVDRVKTYVCEHDNEHKMTEVVTASEDHTPGQKVTKAPTCTDPAKEGTYCTKCGNAVGEEKILTGAGNEALGHSYQIKDATGKFVLNPDAVATSKKDATCTDPELSTFVCTRADDEGNALCDRVPFEVETKEALGHNKADYKKVPRTHNKNAQIVELCTRKVADENGNKVTCGYEWPAKDITEVFGDAVGEEDLAKPECEWEIEAVIKPVTCTTKGTVKIRCSICQEVDFRVVEPHHAYLDDEGNYMPAYGENEAEGKEYTVVRQVEPTCMKTGLDIYTCTRCNESDNIADRIKDVVVDKLPHTLDTGSIERDFVCQAGRVVYKCTNTPCEYKEYGDDVPAQPHQYTSRTIDATCISPAKKGSFCKFCDGANPDVEPEIIAGSKPTGHDFEGTGESDATQVTDSEGNKVWIKNELDEDPDFAGTVTVVDPKCVVEGSTTYECGTCKAKVVVPIAATGHDLETKFEDATCSHPARLVKTCKKENNKVISSENVPGSEADPEAHVWELDEQQEGDPTCKNQLDAAFTCAECGGTKTDKIAHTWPEDGVEVKDGETVIGKSYTCTVENCGAKKYEATADKYAYCDTCDGIKQVVVTGAKPAGCEEVGYTGKQICKNCGKTLKESEEIKAHGHDYRPAKDEPNCGPGREYEQCVYDPTHIQNVKVIPPVENAEHDFTDDNGASSDTCKVCKVKAITMGTTMQAYVEDGSKKIKYTANIKIADPGLKIVSRGLLYYTASAPYTSGDLTVEMFGDVAGVKMYEMASATAVGATKVINMTTVPDRTIYGRAYLIYEDKDGNQHTVYGNMVSGSYNSLTSD